MLYDGYLKTVSERFESSFSEIAAEHNMELGNEFEVALCKSLRLILPNRFGICRGFVVTADGRKAGDDIIIFNRERFGTLRLLDQEDFSRLENIPVETVCAYIEAKHVLALDGDDGQSLTKAFDQVAAVKALPRRKVSWSELSPSLSLGTGVNVPVGWPDHRNPLFTCIWTRGVRLRKGSPVIDDSEAILTAMTQQRADLAPHLRPDLIILGPKAVCLPLFEANGTRPYVSPFFLPGKSQYTVEDSEVGVGVAICSLLYALDFIQVDSLPWEKVIADGLGIAGRMR